MRKLYITLAAFAALTLSQIGHAIPTIPGATDLATDDAQTYYALHSDANGWYVSGYTANGQATGFNITLTPNASLTPANQTLVGLAFDGTNFHVLRNDLVSRKGTDTWTVATFDGTGNFTGNAIRLGPSAHIAPSRQNYVGLSVADEGFFGLRDDRSVGRDSYSNIGFDLATGAFSGFSEVISAQASIAPLNNFAAFNMSPAHFEVANSHAAPDNMSVPEPSTGLILGSMLVLGALGRKKFIAK